MARTNTASGTAIGVTSVDSSDASLLVVPTTGAVDVIVNEAHDFDWTGQHTFNTVLPTSNQTPVNPGDLTPKGYVDTFALGLSVRTSCDFATTAALSANTYNNGVLGVGATLIANANGALASQDGFSPIVGSRGLIKDEGTTANNGLYEVTDLGSVGTPWILTRVTDYDQAAEVFNGTFTTIINGTVNGNKQFVMTNGLASTVIGTDPIVWSVLSNTATNALIKTNNLSDLVNFTTARNNLGVPAILPFFGAQFNPADATTYYFGAFPSIAPTTTANVSRILYPFARTLNRAVISAKVAGTLGSAGNVNLSIRVNGVDFAYGTFTLTAANGTFNISPGTVIIPAGATIEIKILTPTWATNPQQVSLRVDLYLV